MNQIGSGIVQEGYRNPMDIMIDALGNEMVSHKISDATIVESFQCGIVEHCLAWAFGPHWMRQKVKDFPDQWNSRHGHLYQMKGKVSQIILFGKKNINPERELRIVAKHYVMLYLREAWALQKGAKFGKVCPCGSRRKFEKCCGELVEKHFIEGAKKDSETKSLLSKGIINLNKPSKFRKNGLGWFKGRKNKQEEPTNE